MTYNELMLSYFKKKVIELPLYNNDSLVCTSMFVEKGFKITNSQLKKLSKPHYDCTNLKTPHYIPNLD